MTRESGRRIGLGCMSCEPAAAVDMDEAYEKLRDEAEAARRLREKFA